ncbi:XRE family transcriptional regulator [Alicyclobacillus hesperidum subsp. aegles]|uniref:helix-turn-helix domain-containing protein n=1 Tax=Alicyclobacillus hesperidum TaxID=89784 RepID=UPI002228EE4E|nr:RodZ domain-containing protein [Alicyclobacillus hesperidum]GLG00627.1 XRE family transcriptional regulator [Alicyclobacillus hesperidum subsp. aegles]
MQELGQILRSKRESLGLTLDDIEERTKIRKRYVEALEDGDWSVLPGRVYARGFVRTYAEVLGLDGVELLQRYVDGRESGSAHETVRPPSPDAQKRETGSVETERKPAAKMVEPRSLNEFQRSRPRADRTTSQPKRDRARSSGAWIGQGALILAAFVVIGGAYVLIHDHRGAKGSTKEPVKTASKPQTTVHRQQSNSVTGNTVNSTGNTAASKPVKPAPAVQIVAEPYANGAYTYKVLHVTHLQVDVQVVSGQLWMSATTDGANVDPNDLLNAGQSKTFSANQNVTIHLGHVQGVQLSVNGHPVALPNINWAPVIVLQRQG